MANQPQAAVADPYNILRYLSPDILAKVAGNQGLFASQMDSSVDSPYQQQWGAASTHSAGPMDSASLAAENARVANLQQYIPMTSGLASNEGAWNQGYKNAFKDATWDPTYGLLVPEKSLAPYYKPEGGMSPELMFGLALAAFGGLAAAGVGTGAGAGGAAAGGAGGAGGAGANSIGQIIAGSTIGSGTAAGAFAPIAAETAAEAAFGAGAGSVVSGAGGGTGAAGANTTGQIVGGSAPQQSLLDQIAGAYKGIQPYTSAISTAAQIASGKGSAAAAKGAADAQRGTANDALSAQQAALDAQNRIALQSLEQQKAAQAAQLAAQQKAAADQLALQQSMAAYQQQVQMQQLAQQANSAKLQEYQLNRANQRMPDFSAVLQGIRGSARGGQSGTMLTGTSGVDPSLLLLGRNTLLGQ
jgi:hypothetical protein